MQNFLRTLFRRTSTKNPESESSQSSPLQYITVSDDGTKIYRGLQLSASTYKWDTITAEQLVYWVHRVKQLQTPFLVIAKPRSGTEQSEFVQTYWHSDNEYQFEWWNFDRPGRHRECTVASAERVIEMMQTWLDDDFSQLERENWIEE